MSLPSWPWFGPDSPDKLLLYVQYNGSKWSVGQINDALQMVARRFGPSGRFCMVTYRPPRVAAGYAHLWIEENLDFYRPGGRRVNGFAPYTLTFPAQTAWEQRGAWIDERVSRVETIAENMIHEYEHLLGLTHEDMAAGDPHRWNKTLAGLAKASDVARPWR